jgi:putative colanic acid biosynthesis acetyltransferase WcaB
MSRAAEIGSRRHMSAPCLAFIAQDWRANGGNPKFKVFLLFYRLCQRITQRPGVSRWVRLPVDLIYRLVSEFFFGLELPLKVPVGPGLKIYHGFGLVVNDGAILGSGVSLRNGVVIGHRYPGGPSPRLEDGVDVGVAALILGGITIGADAKIGAGAVVLKDVAATDIVVGNPARSLARGSESAEGDARPRP